MLRVLRESRKRLMSNLRLKVASVQLACGKDSLNRVLGRYTAESHSQLWGWGWGISLSFLMVKDGSRAVKNPGVVPSLDLSLLL